jgi:truncated hemoglobin YjbI
MSKRSDGEATLIAAIERYESQAETRGDLASDREKALDYYLGNPIGNEVDGRSQVVSRDVFDTVEWIKPQIAEIFCSGDDVIKFTPRGPEDMESAAQETEYVNHIITGKNEWFITFYSWLHDCLLQKTGYVKAYWHESEDLEKERYAGISEEEVQILLMDPEVKLSGTKDEDGVITYEFERTRKYGCVKIRNLPPENCFVDQAARSTNLMDESCNFTEAREQKTISQLRTEGFDDVDDDLSDAGSGMASYEASDRDETNPWRETDESEDPAMRKVWVRECWIRHDHDGDGKAEMRHVIIVGTTILLNEDADRTLMVALPCTPMPHQHNGLSMADAVNDLQLIKTALLRGALDNIYLANNGRYGVNEKTVNLDDMLVSRPGGLVRVNGAPGDSIFPLTHPTNGQVAIPMLEFVDRIKQQRTGVNEQSQGLDSNTINKNTPYATTAALMSAAQMRIKFIARIIAETGVKQLFELVHALSLKHARKEEIVRLRNQWVPVDPRQWKRRADMEVSVGLGGGDKPQQVQALDGVLMKQMQGLAVGLTDPGKIYNTLKRQTQLMGYKNAEEFWTDPSTRPPPPPPPNPEVEKVQAKAQADMQLAQAQGQIDSQLRQVDAQTDLAKTREQSMLKLREMEGALQLQAQNDQRDHEREMMKAGVDAQLEAQRIEFERWKEEMSQAMAKYKTDQDNATRLQIAEMTAQMALANKAVDLEQQDKMADREDKRAKQDREATPREKPEKSESKGDGEMTKVLSALVETQNTLAEALTRPKTIRRGADGRAEGIE